VERTRATIERHRMLAGGEVVIAAVSGGPDSMCLADVLARVRLDLDLVVAHVDHGLVPESSRVAARVTAWATERGHDVHVIKAPDLAGPNLQARARSFRYSFLESVRRRAGADAVATGHTLDDAVETTLARLVHGAGTEGLAGIPPAEGGRIRPLIETRRTATRAYCEERGIEFYDDPANADPRFERAAVRGELVAAIERRWGDGAVRAIASSARRMREDSAALATLAERLYADAATGEEGAIDLDVETLLALPRALRRRLVERAVGRIRDRSGGIEAALDALEAPLGPPKAFAVASGVEIIVGEDRVRVAGPQ
jgi:tRNA(Ile)-lysidine synthase